MPFGLPWSEQFIQQIADKDDRDEFVADQVRMRIALSIRALREQRGLSQKDFGELLAMPQSVVSRLEDPDYGKLSVQTLLRVATALDIPLSIDFPEWEDWIREGRALRKADLYRRDFNGVLQSAEARENTKIMRFPVGGRDSVIRATVTAVSEDELQRFENVG